MPHNSLHPATLAAQALGWTDASTGALVMPLHTATTFERDPDNQYRRGRSYARADNAAYDQPQAVITALEGGAATLLFASGMAAATAVFRVLPLGAHVVAPLVMYAACGAGSPHTRRGAHRRRFRRRHLARRVAAGDRARAHPPRLDRDPVEPAVVDHRHRRRGGVGACRRRIARGRQHRGDPGPDPAIGARRRSGHAFGDQIPERPQRRDRRLPDDRARRRVLAASRRGAQQRRRDPRQLRSLPAVARHAHAVPAGRARLPLGATHRRSARRQCERGGGALSGSSRTSGTCDRGAPDDRRLRRHAEHPGQGRRNGGDRSRSAARDLEASDLARRGREPCRAPRLESRAPTARCRRTCCACRSASKIPTT